MFGEVEAIAVVDVVVIFEFEFYFKFLLKLFKVSSKHKIIPELELEFSAINTGIKPNNVAVITITPTTAAAINNPETENLNKKFKFYFIF